MFAFNFRPPIDPHKPAPPVISFKPKEKVKSKPKVEEPVITKVEEAPVKEEKALVKKIKVKPLKTVEEMPQMETITEVVEKPKVVETPKVEEPVKKKKLVPGSDEAKEWGKMMKEKRDAKKALKVKEAEEPMPEFM